MNVAGQRLTARICVGLVTAAAIVVLLLLVILLPPDGVERGELFQFLGHFHPIAVHLPIALLVLIPLLEIAGRTRFFPQLLGSVDFLLGVATCGAIGAVTLGWCLGRSGSYSGQLVTQHMWGGILVAAAAWTCWVLRSRAVAAAGAKNLPYFCALMATTAIVSFTGYRGGQLSQGENHLTEHMPERLKGLLGIGTVANASAISTEANAATYFGARVEPIFSEHCVRCHGPNKHKAGLRLDSYEAALRGGETGAVIKAGNAAGSELFRRITLPFTDDDFMPADHKQPLTAAQIKVIETWIANGASGTQLIDAVKEMPSAPVAAAPAAMSEVRFAEVDPVVVAKQRATLASAVTELQKKFPSTIDYESRSSADLVVNMSLLGARFGDAELAMLSPISGQIVSADLSRTAITDKSAPVISGMKRIKSLKLGETQVTDVTVRWLGPLTQLESLNLYDTAVTTGALAAIGQLPTLQHVYLHGTKIPPGANLPDEIRRKAVF